MITKEEKIKAMEYGDLIQKIVKILWDYRADKDRELSATDLSIEIINLVRGES